MIFIALALMCFTFATIGTLRLKHVNLGAWKGPLGILLAASVVWVVFLTVTHHGYIFK